jgi:hypothetical protein
MKKAKDRVIALDYFRGIFILVAVVNHAMIFSMPFAYITGASRLWTSAAEMLLMISGLTFGVVRSDQIKSSFRQVFKKTARRAVQIYLVNISIVILSLLLALILSSKNLTNDVDGALPVNHGFSLLWSIVTMSYSIGWGGFLGYFAVFLCVAPFGLFILKTRAWIMIPLFSLYIYILNKVDPAAFGPYSAFALWQLYFFMGLVLARVRLPVLSFIYNLKNLHRKAAGISIVGLAGVSLFACLLLEDNNILLPRVVRITASGWLPHYSAAAYQHLLSLKPAVDSLLMESRSGVLRPLFSLITLAALYAVFQTYKSFLLAKTGRIITAFGRDTMWIFAAQALVIPILAALPLQRDNLFYNFMLTLSLLLAMWAVTKRNAFKRIFLEYALGLKSSYRTAKYGYLQRYEEESI